MITSRAALLAPVLACACAAAPKPQKELPAPQGPPTVLKLAPCPQPVRAEPPPDMLGQVARELSRFHDHARKTGPVHFAAARVTESRRLSLVASLGGLLEDDLVTDRDRFLDVTVRVGDRHLDSTHPLRGGGDFDGGMGGRPPLLPLSDHEAAVRTVVWRALDDAYDQARRRYLKVRANATISADPEDQSDDFSAEPPVQASEAAPPFAPDEKGFDVSAWRQLLKRLSGRLRGSPAVLDSSVRLLARGDRRFLVNTDGTRLVSADPGTQLMVEVSGRTTDGMELSRQFVLFARDLHDLPGEPELAARVDQLRQELEALLVAPLMDAYSGPAILEGRAAAVFFHEVLGHRLEGHRQRDDAESGTFARRVGQVILPTFLNVIDDPTAGSLAGEPLSGCYRHDDEGVPAQRVVLVEHGVLRSFLLSRQPVRGFTRSNGHGRGEMGQAPVARQGNLIVSADRTVPLPRLREHLLAEVRRQKKPYGLRIAEISGGFTSTQRGQMEGLKVLPQLVYRVYPDGRPDELVRGVDVIATPLTVLSHVIAAADDLSVFNGTCGAESGWVPVSAVAPSLLIDQLEVARAAVGGKRPPLLPPPDGGQGRARP
jgi:predicted Zn-dependent protease